MTHSSRLVPSDGSAGCVPPPLWGGVPEEGRLQLELLDDAVFAAIDGCAESLRRAATLWKQSAATLDWRLVEESREQYLRYAVDVTRQFEFAPEASLDRMLHAIEVIAFLTKA